MIDSTQKLTLFRFIAEEKLDLESVTQDARQVVPTFSVLYGDLTQMLKKMERFDFEDGKQHKWWIARVECSPEQLVAQQQGRYQTRESIYQARESIIVPDGYIPLEEALLRYSGIKNA